MKYFATIAVSMLPGAAFAAAGGTGEGFGPQDWIDKWPVLLIVLTSVVCMTGFIATRIFRRRKEVTKDMKAETV